MSTMNARMPAGERRELILEAATKAFATGGYAGTSTDAVAKEAGVSQPYVVRMFGTKLELFLAVFERACGRIEQRFREVLDERPFDTESEEDLHRLGGAYVDLLADRNWLQVMMHGFSAGSVPEIGEAARERMGSIYETVRRTGWSDEQVRDFISHGMLLNVLLSIGAFETAPGALGDLVRACIPDHHEGVDSFSDKHGLG
ncbi:TetR/AcrR family transcriptional regulator [Nocardioides sp. Kera G14]|uniref:TetR/AcrR family transcriptional regulator n=1 Tax=Nocardioides sp. Kera G14 TaxID=2884264 RepID=UPI001D1232B0|nr:TetR/AcrR family transcriptional regulator [Nocardioides sp. Kera G14]UDY23527.1 TetR/AcrR family transcriptional regulator [Nocardioides sp. Kera G14]